MRLLENPVLLEHQAFTDLLRAVFHLAEELAYRKSVEMMAERRFELTWPATSSGHITCW